MKNSLSHRNKFFNWVRNTLIGLIVIGAIFAFLITDSPAIANEEEVTVPINQVVKMDKLSAEQLTKAKVTVPRSWVDQDYLEKHFPQGEESSQPEATNTKSPGKDINNIPDGTLIESPKIISEQDESITVSDFHFEFSYNQGDLKRSIINFTVKNENGNIEDIKLLLNGEKQLTPKDGAYVEATEKFSYGMQALEEGNLYEGTLEVKGENESDSVEFQVYPREFLNIADDDEINIGAHYCVWYSKPGSVRGADWTGEKKSFYEPKLGKYSSLNGEVVAKHIDWATGHGIDLFLINWWKTPGMDKRVHNFLDNPLADEINYAILEVAIPTNFDDSVYKFSRRGISDSFRGDMEYMVRNFLDDKNYFRINGNPVVYLYEEDKFRGPFPEAMERSEEFNKTINGSGIYWVGDNRIPFESQNKQREVLDAITDYSPQSHWISWIPSPGEEWVLDVDNLKERYVPLTKENYFDARERGKSYIPTVALGYNNPSTDMTTIQRTPEGFRYEIEQAKKMVGQKIKTIFVTSFNEWLESTSVEPSKEWGFKYLNIIKDELAGYDSEEELKEELNHIEFRFDKTGDPGESGGREMSIRPSKVRFYGSSSSLSPELRIDFGSSEDIENLGRGWSVREKEKGSGRTFRWSNKYGESSLFTPKSKDLSYMELEADAITSDIEADVYLNGKLVDHINFEKGWQTYTVELSS